MDEIKFAGWVRKGFLFEDLNNIGAIWHNVYTEKPDRNIWPSFNWPPYQVEITVKKVEV